MDSRVVAKSDELDRREVDEMLSRFADKKHGIAGTPSRPHFCPHCTHNFLNVVTTWSVNVYRFGPDWLAFAGVIPERLLFSAPEVTWLKLALQTFRLQHRSSMPLSFLCATSYERRLPSCTEVLWVHKYTRNSSVNEIGERYAKIPITAWTHAMVVKLYHFYTQFPRNVPLLHRRIASFFRQIVTFLPVIRSMKYI